MIRGWAQLFATSAAITLRSLPTFGSVGVALIRIGVVPIATGLFYLALASGAGAVRPGPDDAIAAGVAVGATAASMAASSLVTLDKFEGTLTHLLLSSGGRGAAWAGRVAVLVGLGLVTAAVVTVVTLLVGATTAPSPQWWFFPLVLLVGGIGGTAVGVFLGALGLGTRDSLLAANIAEFALPLLCGAVAPITVLPEPLQWLARVVPVTSAISGGRLAAAGAAPGGVLTQLAMALGVALVWFAAGFVTWRLVERRVRATGTVDVTPL